MYVIPLVTMVTAYLLIFATIARKSRDFLQQGKLPVGSDERQINTIFRKIAPFVFNAAKDSSGIVTNVQVVVNHRQPI